MAKKKNIVSLTLLGTVPALSLQAQGGAQAVDPGLQQGLFKGVGQLKNFLKISNTKLFILKTLSVVGAVTICWLLFVLDKEVANKKLLDKNDEIKNLEKQLEQKKNEREEIIGNLKQQIGEEVLEKMKNLYKKCEKYIEKVKERRVCRSKMDDLKRKSNPSNTPYMDDLISNPKKEILEAAINNYEVKNVRGTFAKEQYEYARIYYPQIKEVRKKEDKLNKEMEGIKSLLTSDETKKGLEDIKSSIKEAFKIGDSSTWRTIERQIVLEREENITKVYEFLEKILKFLDEEKIEEETEKEISISDLIDLIGSTEITDKICIIDSDIIRDEYEKMSKEEESNRLEENLKKTHFFPGQYTLFS